MAIYDAFEDKLSAKRAAEDLGNKAFVRKLLHPQDSGRLKYGVYTK